MPIYIPSYSKASERFDGAFKYNSESRWYEEVDFWSYLYYLNTYNLKIKKD